MNYPLRVAVIWHMHQPYYKDLASGRYLLPWVRLHATKDYYDMAAILDRFPGIRQTFNLVPSLLTQIDDYAAGNGRDSFLELSVKRADDLSEADREFILCNFFLANWENMVKPFSRYWELLHKRGLHCSREKIREATRFFSEGDLLDLQFLFNLCWFDPLFRREDPFLSSMAVKGRGYTEEEKEHLLEKQREIIAMIIPNYRRLMEEGRVELTTTPFYHPILPLLCDTNVATRAMPHIKLPDRPFRHPEDADVQLERAVNFHKEIFGTAPKGMWPSEGSVSEEALALIASKGIEWVATDEEILEASSRRRIKRGKHGVPENPAFLYKPYLYNTGDRDMAMIFRDHKLSDLIGFVYSSWEPASAAKDFMGKLHGIRESLGKENRRGDHLVTVILDGENCWEHYKNDGWDFLTNLYERVENDPLIEMVTVSEHLNEHPPEDRLEHVFPGSWINHNFKIWIGHDEDNLAWDYLKTTRDDLLDAGKNGTLDEKTLRKAWEHIYIAEGSDWCWWYGDEHSTENDADFDGLFRKNLINVYALIGKEPPEELHRPIIKIEKHLAPAIEAVSFITPTIDGEVTDYFEWLGAAVIYLERTGGAMHKVSHILSRIHCGFNMNSLFLRMDLDPDVECEEIPELTFSAIIRSPEELRIDFNPASDLKPVMAKKGDTELEEAINAAFEDIVEFEIPFKLLEADCGDEIEYYVSVSRNGGEVERWPSVGYLTVKVPGEDFESEVWNAYA